MLILQSLIKQWDIKAQHPLSGNLYDVITSCALVDTIPDIQSIAVKPDHDLDTAPVISTHNINPNHGLS